MKGPSTEPVSVLLICHSYPPVLGGSEIEAQRVCSALIGRGHRIRVVCAGGEPMPAVRDWVDPKGVPVRIYAGHWKGAMRDIVFALRVAGMLIHERKKYQIVYFLMQGLHLAVGLPISKALGKPILMKVSGSGVVPLMSRSRFGRLELAWLRRWARFVMVLNDGMRQEAVDYGLSPDQLVWMPNPVDTAEFVPAIDTERNQLRSQLGIPVGARVALYCGRLAPEKRLNSLLEGFALVAGQVPRSMLVLVGDGPSRAELERQVQQLSLQTKIRFAGAVDPLQVSRWLKIADVFTLVSALEGFPCALAEAMSTGLASVVTDIPANRQLVKADEHGLLVPVGKPGAIAHALAHLLTDASLRTRMGQAARNSILENYATSRIAERYEILFQSALVPKRSSPGRSRSAPAPVPPHGPASGEADAANYPLGARTET